MKEKTISVKEKIYNWDEQHQAFLRETSLGSYGAILKDKKWHPVFWGDGCYEMDICDEKFEDCPQAIERSLSFFT